MNAAEFLHVDPRAVLASTTNPRKHFDPAKLQELADSIAASGVHQPVLLRPLPAARVPDTVGLKPRPTHEMVAGERRLRASLLAGVATIPAMVRDLTDAQVLEIQIIENLQRDDLNPLEEAEGYRYLIDHTGLNAQEVGGKIGKSRAYVYARLKLLDLAPDARHALADGRLDASRALLLARIPDTALQAQACKTLTRVDYRGDMISYRAAAEYVQREFMLRLKEAPFSQSDATLVPEAGACKACPKRTGANPDLFTDVKGADVCTDPPCYRRKEEAHADMQLKAARESGAEVIEGREAKALMPNAYSGRVEGYLRLDNKADSPTKEPLRKLIGRQMKAEGITPTLVANPHNRGELVAVLPADQVANLLRAAGQEAEAAETASNAADATAYKAKQAEEEAKRALEHRWRWQVLEAIWPAAKEHLPALAQGVNNVLRHAAAGYVQRLNNDRAKALCKLLNLGKVAPKAGVEQWVAGAPSPLAALALLVAHNDVGYSVRYVPPQSGHAASDADDDGWTEREHDNTELFDVAALLGVDYREIERRARSDARADAMAAKKAEKATKPALAPEGDPPLAPAARRARNAKAGAEEKRPAARRARSAERVPTLGEAQARENIAAAMQAVGGEPESGAADAAQRDDARPVLRPDAPAPSGTGDGVLAVGQQVKVLASAKGPGQKRWVGHVGEVTAQVGDSAWDVRFKPKRKGMPAGLLLVSLTPT